MSEGYIGLAPSYGVFQKQVIAGTTASIYDLDFDVVQSTQIMVSIDGIVQEPDWAFSIGRNSSGQMQITFAEALTVTTTTGNTTAGSNSLTNVTTSGIVVGQGITGTGIRENTHVQAIPTENVLLGTPAFPVPPPPAPPALSPYAPAPPQPI